SSDKKQGAQKVIKAPVFSITQEPNDIIPHIPDACKNCSSFSKCSKSYTVAEKRYEVDVVVKTKVILHQVMSVECPKCDNEILKGTFPEHITSTMQYGQNLQALVIALNTIGMVSINRTHKFLSDLFCIPISTGTIHKMVTECAQKILPVIDVIKEKIIASPIVHFDETGTRVDNKTCWVHNASNSKYTYLTVEDKRGYEGIESSGILPNYIGIAIHDCWSSKMIELLLNMKKQKDKAVFMSKEEPTYYYTHKFHKEYQSIIEEARKLNPIPEKVPSKSGRQGKGKIRAS
ncbi:IS66 family transposase, partial [Cellulosilyticum ruminicola]|uniref:IS66 family transposase n=1 Tax=Cellulosilyticum ruminicola TaxID=425254 RepID=UPI0006D2B0F2